MRQLWVEKWRPSKVSEYVFCDESQKNFVAQVLQDKVMPSILLFGPAGTGKTSMAKMLLNELDVDPADILFLNGSSENGVDVIRDKITNFVTVMPFGDFRYVFIDECLHENTEVVVYRNGQEILSKIKDVDARSDLVKSYNVDLACVEYKPFMLFDKGVQECVTIEFENDVIVTCTLDHKWYVEDEQGNVIVVKTRDLEKYMHILTPL